MYVYIYAIYTSIHKSRRGTKSPHMQYRGVWQLQGRTENGGAGPYIGEVWV